MILHCEQPVLLHLYTSVTLHYINQCNIAFLHQFDMYFTAKRSVLLHCINQCNIALQKPRLGNYSQHKRVNYHIVCRFSSKSSTVLLVNKPGVMCIQQPVFVCVCSSKGNILKDKERKKEKNHIENE